MGHLVSVGAKSDRPLHPDHVHMHMCVTCLVVVACRTRPGNLRENAPKKKEIGSESCTEPVALLATCFLGGSEKDQ